MNYSLSSSRSLWSSTVAVPKQIVEKHLKMAGARQLKALLYLLSSAHEAVSAAELADFLCCGEAELEESMAYWVACGVLCPQGEDVQQAQAPAQALPEKEQATVHFAMQPPRAETAEPPVITKVLEAPRLRPQDILNRGREDCRIAGLLNEAQSVLCRSISHSEQEMLVNMVDYYGLKPEVVLMILTYAKSVGKTNTRYLLSMAKDWGDEGIQSMEQAEQKLEEIALCDSQWQTVCQIAELPSKTPTAKQREYTLRWLHQWQVAPELLQRAFEIAKDNEIKKAFPYVDKILLNWRDKQITNLAQLAKLEEQKAAKSGEPIYKKGRISTKASYDIHQIEEESFTETLNFGG